MKVVMHSLDRRTLAAVSRTPAVTKGVRQGANAVRRIARRGAPKRTGAGARSIAVQRWYDKPTGMVTFRVTWDRSHFYMIFNEDGSRTNRARHFLRQAAEQVNNDRGA
jgi:HK97 gp10 family phage protein